MLIASIVSLGPSRAPAAPADSVARIAPSVYRVGGVTVDVARRTVEMHGRINMDHGPVELLACTPYGKRHESVLALDAAPHHLQVALLLLGLEPTHRPLAEQGDPATPTGDSVVVEVSWRDSTGTPHVMRGEDLLLDMKTGQAMGHTPWIFVGSRIVGGQFQAQIFGNLITTYHDPDTILDNPLPGGADDTVYSVRSGVCPRVGTEVTVVLRPAGSRSGQAPNRENPR